MENRPTDSVSLLESAATWMRAQGWQELLGKQRVFTQSLYHHVLAQLNFVVAIRPLLCDPKGFGMSEQQLLAVFVGSLCHDVGKEDPAWQEAVRRGVKPPDHVHHERVRGAIEEWVDRLGSGPQSGFLEAALAAVRLHHKATQGAASTFDELLHGGHADPRWRELADIVEGVDKVCSSPTVVEAALEAKKRFGDGRPEAKFAVAHHRVRLLRGVSTTLLHRACHDAYAEAGWTPALHFADGSLYVALVGARPQAPSTDLVREKSELLFGRLLEEANIPQQVVAKNFTTKALSSPELFDPGHMPEYLAVAATRLVERNFRSKHSDKAGRFNAKFCNESDEKPGLLQKYCRQKHIPSPPTQAEQAGIFERFAKGAPLDAMFRFFKDVALGDSFIYTDNWRLSGEELMEIKGSVAKLRGDEAKRSAAREKKIAKKKEEALKEWLATVKKDYEREFGDGSFDDLGSVTNDPARNLAKVVDHFLDQDVPGEDIKWASKPSVELQQELIRRLSKIWKTAIEQLSKGTLPEPLNGRRLSEVFMDDLLLEGHPSSIEVGSHLDAYVVAKEDGEHVSLCAWTNEVALGSDRTGSDLGLATDGHSNRLPMQSKTWKNRGGVATALSSRYELLLRRLILGAPSAQLIVLLPPVQLGPAEGRRLVDAVGQLDAEVALYSRELTPEPTRRFSFALTDQIARSWSAEAGRPLVNLLSYTSAEKTAEEHKKSLGHELEEAFGPGDDGLELAAFNEAHGTKFNQWSEARRDKRLKADAESKYLELAVNALNEECQTSFPQWDGALDEIYQNQSDAARKALESEEVRERRKRALKLRDPGRFVCQTPNLILALLPESLKLKVGKNYENDANAAVRQLFLACLIASNLGVSVAIIDRGEALTFTGGEGMALVPPNAALRAEVSRVRRARAAEGIPVGSSPTHDWLLPHEVAPWLQALAAAHAVAGNHWDRHRKWVELFPATSALYAVLSSRSVGFLLRRLEQKTGRAAAGDELNQLTALEQFVG